ncbi:MAG: OsmC family protein [Verrucomicrobiota bacterium]
MNIQMIATPAGGKKVEVQAGDHIVRTDLLEGSGGENSAPEPLDMLFASLASCTTNYVLEFCRSRDIDTDGLKVLLQAGRSEETGLFDDISLKLDLPENFPEKYRKAVIRAAEKCTVKKHFEAAIEVKTTLGE